MKIRILFIGLVLLAYAAGCSSWKHTSPNARLEVRSSVEAILARIKAPEFPDRDFAITNFGAAAGTDCTDAIRRAIAACHEAGGGRVVVPAGIFRTGAVHLKSNVNLHLVDGATLKFDPDPAKYPIVFTRWEGVECMNYSPLVYAYGQENVAVTGKGTLHGSATADNWLGWNMRQAGAPAKQVAARNRLFEMGQNNVPVAQRVFGEGSYLRPNFIQIYASKNVLIEGVTIINSPMWMIHPVLCTNVTVRGVTVRSHGRNNDGCDPESCRDVLIEDCIFDTGDDCIAIKSGRNNDGRRVGVASENIIIRRCMMKDGHGGVTIGSEISGGCRNVFAEQLKMDSPDLNQAIRFKSNAQRGGVIENIHVRDVQIGRVGVSAVSVEFDYEEGAKGPHKPILRNVTIENMSTQSCGQVLNLGGFPGAVIEKIKLKDCTFRGVEKPDRINHAQPPVMENVTIEQAWKATSSAQETQRQYLSGKGSDDAVAWEFFCSAGAKSGKWTTIPVPSCWDALGFGTLNYGKDGEVAEQGKYRHRFKVQDGWQARKVFVVFDGVMTDARVTVNGKSAGPRHEGGFYRFSYDVTEFVKFDAENVLEVIVDKRSANESVNRAEREADYWVFGGIFRPVWLEAKPIQHIERVAIDARADGTLAVDVFTSGGASVEAEVKDAGKPFTAAVKDGKGRVEGKIDSPRTWTAETPNLYECEVRLLDGAGKVVHRITQRFGFRTVEVRKGDGVYVNGKRILLKGTNRHSFWPESGRTTSEKLSREDVRLMKEMNCNAVRMSHYPPDEHFLDACDEVGLYALDELGGWQKSYDTPTARRLVGEMIRRDVNHPSILFWDNGNEGGWNTEVDDEFAKWDPQKRHVLHPWELHDGMQTKHYRFYDDHVKLCAGPDVFMPTEFLHGLFDGGGGAGLADYWEATRKSKFAAGGFIWAWVDEAVKRPESGKMDTAGNRAPDGVVGPYREKEASYFAIKEIWSPVVVRRRGEREFEVENRYDFTNTSECRFTWELRDYAGPWDKGQGQRIVGERQQKITVAPGQRAVIVAEVPEAKEGVGEVLAVRVDDPAGREVWTWEWMLREPAPVKPPGESAALPGGEQGLWAVGGGKLKRAEWRQHPDGWIELEYAYALDGQVDYHGIAIDFRERGFQSIRWMGQGPNRVWKNRLAGNTLGVWETQRNDTITGYSRWQYPEFAGCYAGVRWMRIEMPNGSLVIELEDPSLFVQVGKPKFPGDPKPFAPTTAATRKATNSQLSGNAWANLPDAGLAILHAIPAIGTKFQLASTTGPMGQQNVANGEYRGRVRFYFGEQMARQRPASGAAKR